MQSLFAVEQVLEDVNKVLSLYASKILDCIIATEGFEHILAADYSEKVEPAPTVPISDSPPSTLKKSCLRSVIQYKYYRYIVCQSQ